MTAVGRLIAEARKAEPGLVVAIVSDHGFAPVEHAVNLIAPFVQAGLITLDAKTQSRRPGRPSPGAALPRRWCWPIPMMPR